jgi:hypothetical protein
MSAQPPPQQGQVSPDGRWWWDGAKWEPRQQTSLPDPHVPAQAQPSAYPPAVYVYGPRSNSYAVASLVIGILSWFLCPLIGGVIAVVLGHIARGQIRRSGEGGAGLAMAGLILGYAHLAFVGIFILFWLVVFGGMAAMLGAIGSMPVPSPTP